MVTLKSVKLTMKVNRPNGPNSYNSCKFEDQTLSIAFSVYKLVATYCSYFIS